MLVADFLWLQDLAQGRKGSRFLLADSITATEAESGVLNNVVNVKLNFNCSSTSATILEFENVLSNGDLQVSSWPKSGSCC